jgi:hypothetical protein
VFITTFNKIVFNNVVAIDLFFAEETRTPLVNLQICRRSPINFIKQSKILQQLIGGSL